METRGIKKITEEKGILVPSMAEPSAGARVEAQLVSPHTQPRDTGERPGRESQTPQPATKVAKQTTSSITSGKAPKGKTAKPKQGPTQKTTATAQSKPKAKPIAKGAKAPEQTTPDINQRMSNLESMMAQFIAAQNMQKQPDQQPGPSGSTAHAHYEYDYEAEPVMSDTRPQQEFSEIGYAGDEQVPYDYSEHGEYPAQISANAEEAEGYESQSVYSGSGVNTGSQEHKPAELTALAAKICHPLRGRQAHQHAFGQQH